MKEERESLRPSGILRARSGPSLRSGRRRGRGTTIVSSIIPSFCAASRRRAKLCERGEESDWKTCRVEDGGGWRSIGRGRDSEERQDRGGVQVVRPGGFQNLALD